MDVFSDKLLSLRTDRLSDLLVLNSAVQ